MEWLTPADTKQNANMWNDVMNMQSSVRCHLATFAPFSDSDFKLLPIRCSCNKIALLSCPALSFGTD